MYDYVKGQVKELTPTYLVLDCNNIGYFINISLHTYSQMAVDKEATIYLHQVIREDAHLFFGFNEKKEREIFRLLITVSGVGANTARMILSSLSPDETVRAIASENVNTLQNVKGIGAKTAQRMIVDLRDKITRLQVSEEIFAPRNNTAHEESLSALVMLGFSKVQSNKVLEKIIREEPDLSVEDMIKKALRLL